MSWTSFACLHWRHEFSQLTCQRTVSSLWTTVQRCHWAPTSFPMAGLSKSLNFHGTAITLRVSFFFSLIIRRTEEGRTPEGGRNGQLMKEARDSLHRQTGPDTEVRAAVVGPDKQQTFIQEKR
ncbi:unnamed protein product [Protopolystoma xenopodis]|uniref:Uncharacterized protein n=1 Tax=Protopolystoma xenopodis TaxID=117903 RepID=A0A3S5B1K4_9PLAT|nr:unnamed protein product [Protopolystoma xenopodis]